MSEYNIMNTPPFIIENDSRTVSVVTREEFEEALKAQEAQDALILERLAELEKRLDKVAPQRSVISFRGA